MNFIDSNCDNHFPNFLSNLTIQNSSQYFTTLSILLKLLSFNHSNLVNIHGNFNWETCARIIYFPKKICGKFGEILLIFSFHDSELLRVYFMLHEQDLSAILLVWRFDFQLLIWIKSQILFDVIFRKWKWKKSMQITTFPSNFKSETFKILHG